MQIRQMVVALCCVMLCSITVSSIVETADQALTVENKTFTREMAVEMGITYEDEVPEGYYLPPDVFEAPYEESDCGKKPASVGFLGGNKTFPFSGGAC